MKYFVSSHKKMDSSLAMRLIKTHNFSPLDKSSWLDSNYDKYLKQQERNISKNTKKKKTSGVEQEEKSFSIGELKYMTNWQCSNTLKCTTSPCFLCPLPPQFMHSFYTIDI